MVRLTDRSDMTLDVYGGRKTTIQQQQQFSKGDNFRDNLFADLEDKVFPKWGLPLKERICFDKSKFFSLRADP